jgi:hypothetical protein
MKMGIRIQWVSTTPVGKPVVWVVGLESTTPVYK